MANPEQMTDGTLDGWDCSVSIIGCKEQGYDLSCIPYQMGDGESAPHDIAMKIEAVQGSFNGAKSAREFAEKSGFKPDTKWGEMS